MGLFKQSRVTRNQVISFHVWDGRRHTLVARANAKSEGAVRQQAIAAGILFLRQNEYASVPVDFTVTAVDQDSGHILSLTSSEMSIAVDFAAPGVRELACAAQGIISIPELPFSQE